MFGALIRAAERWPLDQSHGEHRQITAVRRELDQDYEAQVGLKTQLSKDVAPMIQQSSDLTADEVLSGLSAHCFYWRRNNRRIDGFP